MVVCFPMPPQLHKSDSACIKCTAVQLSTCDSESTIKPLAQGSSNLSQEVQSAAEFSSSPDQTRLPVIF